MISTDLGNVGEPFSQGTIPEYIWSTHSSSEYLLNDPLAVGLLDDFGEESWQYVVSLTSEVTLTHPWSVVTKCDLFDTSVGWCRHFTLFNFYYYFLVHTLYRQSGAPVIVLLNVLLSFWVVCKMGHFATRALGIYTAIRAYVMDICSFDLPTTMSHRRRVETRRKGSIILDSSLHVSDMIPYESNLHASCHSGVGPRIT